MRDAETSTESKANCCPNAVAGHAETQCRDWWCIYIYIYIYIYIIYIYIYIYIYNIIYIYIYIYMQQEVGK